jgi:flagellar basal-body rod protein FlgB
MDLNGIPLFSLMSGRMSWLSSRQSVLATNIANADTPEFTARDLKPAELRNMVGAQTPRASMLSVTNIRHIAIRTPGPGIQEENARGEGGSPNGNKVSMEQEMMKLSDTQIQYQTATNLYQKAVGMIRTALNGRPG